MAFSVYQHWDPLKVCLVGKSYPPEFYSYIKNSKVRTVLERIAIETEEDYLALIKKLESFNVKVLRPNINPNQEYYLIRANGTGPFTYLAPPMTPRDYSMMLGENWFFNFHDGYNRDVALCNAYAQQESQKITKITEFRDFTWGHAIELIEQSGCNYYNTFPEPIKNRMNSAMTARVGRDLYLGNYTEEKHDDATILRSIETAAKQFPEYRWNWVKTEGHTDGTFCPVKPGLIVTLDSYTAYNETFPDWEVVDIRGQSWGKITPFLLLKKKNRGKWWVPGEELNDEFTDFVETWLNHWVGYVEETVFDVNMLVIDEKNVICNNYNEKVFAAFDRHGITPHVINFRHRYFWDGGLHCITSDVHREGTMHDYFPERGNRLPRLYDISTPPKKIQAPAPIRRLGPLP